MMRIGFAAAALLIALSAGCGRKEKPAEPAPPTAAPQASVAAAATGVCGVAVSRDWVAGGRSLVIEAQSSGDDCTGAGLRVSIRDKASGKVLFSQAHKAESLLVMFGEATDPESMKAALTQWIGPDAARSSTKDLPAWGEGQTQPNSGEFPFYPEEGMTRERYSALRDAGMPLFCHVQGGESEACLAFDGSADAMVKVGLQTFPG
jgi:hypothetical protein